MGEAYCNSTLSPKPLFLFINPHCLGRNTRLRKCDCCSQDTYSLHDLILSLCVSIDSARSDKRCNIPAAYPRSMFASVAGVSCGRTPRVLFTLSLCCTWAAFPNSPPRPARAPQVVLLIKDLPANAGDMRCRFSQWIGKIPWRRAWQPTPVFLPGESHGQRSLAVYSPWGHKESAMTEAT